MMRFRIGKVLGPRLRPERELRNDQESFSRRAPSFRRACSLWIVDVQATPRDRDRASPRHPRAAAWASASTPRAKPETTVTPAKESSRARRSPTSRP